MPHPHRITRRLQRLLPSCRAQRRLAAPPGWPPGWPTPRPAPPRPAPAHLCVHRLDRAPRAQQADLHVRRLRRPPPHDGQPGSEQALACARGREAGRARQAGAGRGEGAGRRACVCKLPWARWDAALCTQAEPWHKCMPSLRRGQKLAAGRSRGQPASQQPGRPPTVKGQLQLVVIHRLVPQRLRDGDRHLAGSGSHRAAL